MQVKEKIIQQICNEGPMSFRDFMEMALYHPECGYYTSCREKIGSEGDYYTSPYLGNIFGAMIGRQLEEMWQLLNKQPFTIVEYGAGSGMLCRDILKYLQSNPLLYNNLTYYIIEKSGAMREKEKAVLAAVADKVKWINSISEIQSISGCVLSNEVVDNFAVHLVEMQDELMEVFVDYDDKFIELHKPASDELKDYLSRFNIVLSKGYRTEINPEAENWIKDIAGTLKEGFVLTIDYGYAAEEFYHKERKTGTLLCYHKHAINDDPYKNIGEQDITTHVNFSALLHAGMKEGLHCCGFTTQSNFMLSLGLTDYLRQLEQKTDATINCKETSLFTLMAGMGQKLKVLIQKKGQAPVSLTGIRFPLWLK